VNPEAPPTVRQVYAIAGILCQLCDEEFPKDRAAASELIERYRRELGHPNPRLEDMPRAPRTRRAVSPKTERIREFHRRLDSEDT